MCPCYTVKCPFCEHKEDVVCPVDERNTHACPECQTLMEVQIGRVFTQWNTECPTASGGRPIND